jgi:hypothetical protein
MLNVSARVPFTRACGTFVIVCALLAPHTEAAELKPATSRAYDSYVEQARRAFVARVAAPHVSLVDSERKDAVAGEADIREPFGQTLRIPGGVVHHWRGAIFIPGVRLEQVLTTAQTYENYAVIYEAVLASKLLSRDGNRFQVFARLKEDAGIVSAVLDVWSAVTYERAGDCAYSLSEARDIRQVERAEQADERHLPQGRDSGYLWRANTFTRFVPSDSGVLVELETIGLSRSFSRLVAWIIEPIARRVGRSSIEQTLADFRSAVLAQRF